MPSSKSFGCPPFSVGTNERPVYHELTGNMQAFCSVWKYRCDSAKVMLVMTLEYAPISTSSR